MDVDVGLFVIISGPHGARGKMVGLWAQKYLRSLIQFVKDMTNVFGQIMEVFAFFFFYYFYLRYKMLETNVHFQQFLQPLHYLLPVAGESSVSITNHPNSVSSTSQSDKRNSVALELDKLSLTLPIIRLISSPSLLMSFGSQT